MSAVEHFRQYDLDLNPDTFEELSQTHELEVYDACRRGRILVDLEEQHIPFHCAQKEERGVCAGAQGFGVRYRGSVAR